jgi:signal recognition particle subunit SRP54
MASRILGMGDVLSLIEEAEQKLDRKKAERLATKIKKGKGFDLEDFRDQLQQMKSMGGMQGMLEKLPGMGQMAKAAEQSLDQKRFAHMEALICAMTPKERRFPDLISGSRKQRIARGSGLQVQDVNRLLKQHKQMQKMMKKMGQKGGMQKMMRGMGALMGGGGMPPMPPPGGLRRR